MTLDFTHDTLAQRVLFGAGKAREHVAAEVERLGATRVMLIASEREMALAEPLLAGIEVALPWQEVRQHVPIENVHRARTAAAEAGVDVIVSVGGGSTVGLAKAIALDSRQPIIAVPTTYAGSEATPMWGITEEGTKSTGIDVVVLPTSVVYDSELTLSLPVGLSVASGLNGLAHCVDSLWAPKADPINIALGLEGARALASGLPQIVDDPRGRDGRDEALYGAYLAALSFASAGSGMHHKICHALGGTFDLPHAETHATVLPYVLAFNAPGVPGLARRLAQALGGAPASDADGPEAAVEALQALRSTLDAPRALADVGFTEDDIPEAVRRVLAVVPASNPVPVTEANLTALLRAALVGDVPGRV